MATAVDTERRRDHRRRIAVDVALTLAEMNAGWCDYERALEHLAAADRLTHGALAGRLHVRQAEWAAHAIAG